MAGGLPEPAPGYRWELQVPEGKRKRSARPWIVSLIVVVALGVALWFVGEWLARDIVQRTIRAQVVETLGLPADQPVDIDLPGAVLPQLLRGSLDELTVSSDDVSYATLGGDVSVTARDIPISGDGPIGESTASLSMNEEQVRALLAQVEGFPAETLGMADPNVTMSTQVTVLGMTLPIGVALEPGADAGDFTFTPASLTIAEAEVTAEQLRERIGRLADPILRTWSICVRDHIPSGLTLADVRVEGERLLVDVDISRDILTDDSLTAVGSCG